MTGQGPGQPDPAVMLALLWAGGRTWWPPEVATDLCPTVRPTPTFWILATSCSHRCLCVQLWWSYKCSGTASCHFSRVPPSLFAEINQRPFHLTWEAEKHEVVQKSSARTVNHTEPLFLSPTGNESELFCWTRFWWELKLSWNNFGPS